jgi:hypothetical protein
MLRCVGKLSTSPKGYKNNYFLKYNIRKRILSQSISANNITAQNGSAGVLYRTIEPVFGV